MIILFNVGIYISLVLLGVLMVLVLYLFLVGYGVLIVWCGEGYIDFVVLCWCDLFVVLLVIVYVVWLVYVGGVV